MYGYCIESECMYMYYKHVGGIWYAFKSALCKSPPPFCYISAPNGALQDLNKAQKVPCETPAELHKRNSRSIFGNISNYKPSILCSKKSSSCLKEAFQCPKEVF